MNKPSPKNDARAPLEIDLQLGAEELQSACWEKTRKALEARIWKLREMNDNTSHDSDKTLEIRTEIKVLKGLLKNDPRKEFSTPRPAVMQHELDASESSPP